MDAADAQLRSVVEVGTLGYREGAAGRTHLPALLLPGQQPSHGGFYGPAFRRRTQPHTEIASGDGDGQLVAILSAQFLQLLPGRRRWPRLSEFIYWPS